jgi:hypothetical protein
MKCQFVTWGIWRKHLKKSSSVYEWHKRFSDGREDVEDDK